MSEEQVPPGPWKWTNVIPEDVPGFDPETEPHGEALVAADGSWLVWSESGYGSPDLHPAVKDLLANAWQLEEAKRIGRWLYEHAPAGLRHELGDVSEWPWLEEDA